MEITKKEILASISIVAVMMSLGFIISGRIQDSQNDKNDMYNKAVKITDSEQFQYGMRTNVGNAFVYGDLKCVDTVSWDGIDGEYMSMTKVTEEYTRHTKTVDDFDSEGNHVGFHEEVYYSWDEIDRDYKKCKEVKFLGVKFDSSKFSISNEVYIDTVKKDIFSDIRYKYYGSATQYTGTIFTSLSNKTISDGSKFYKDKNIEETVEYLERGGGIIVFWLCWLLLIVGGVSGFYYLNNNWLE